MTDPDAVTHPPSAKSPPTRMRKSYWLITTYQFGYSIISGLCTLLSGYVAIGFMLRETPDVWAALVFFAVALYGLAATLAMLLSGRDLLRRDVRAPRRTRSAMILALPGSLFVGLVGLVMMAAREGAPIGLLLSAAAAANLLILARVLFGDIEKLLWQMEAERPGFDALNFMESE